MTEPGTEIPVADSPRQASQSGGQKTATQSVANARGKSAIIDEPIDVHLNVTSLLRGGPPRLVIDVWHEDDNARFELSGYGFAHLPVAPGDRRNADVILTGGMAQLGLKPAPGEAQQ